MASLWRRLVIVVMFREYSGPGGKSTEFRIVPKDRLKNNLGFLARSGWGRAVRNERRAPKA